MVNRTSTDKKCRVISRRVKWLIITVGIQFGLKYGAIKAPLKGLSLRYSQEEGTLFLYCFPALTLSETFYSVNVYTIDYPTVNDKHDIGYDYMIS